MFTNSMIVIVICRRQLIIIINIIVSGVLTSPSEGVSPEGDFKENIQDIQYSSSRKSLLFETTGVGVGLGVSKTCMSS